MIHKLLSSEIETDLNITVNPDNKMELIINFTFFNKHNNKIINDRGPIIIDFQSNNKYDTSVFIHILKSGKIIIDEPFNDHFYYESEINDSVDKICWFTIPKDYQSDNGLQDLAIYVKRGRS